MNKEKGCLFHFIYIILILLLISVYLIMNMQIKITNFGLKRKYLLTNNVDLLINGENNIYKWGYLNSGIVVTLDTYDMFAKDETDYIKLLQVYVDNEYIVNEISDYETYFIFIGTNTY